MIDFETNASPDAQAIILICSSLGTNRGSTDRAAAAKPFGPRTWARLQAALSAAELAGPSSLVGLPASEVDGLVGLGPADSKRVVQLLARGGQLAFELDRLRSRGVWVLTLADEEYPPRLRDRLVVDAPPVLFGAGDPMMLSRGGVAIVGSRDADDAAEEFTRRLAAALAATGTQSISGGARGVDEWAMQAASEGGGAVIGVLPEGIERRLREPQNRAGVAGGSATLVSPYRPDASFSAGAAMARNKVIYALSDVAVVVSSSKGSGGTWTGALEALNAQWVPVLVRDGDGVPEGNRELVRRGGGSLPTATPFDDVDVDTLRAIAGRSTGTVAQSTQPYLQPTLFED